MMKRLIYCYKDNFGYQDYLSYVPMNSYELDLLILSVSKNYYDSISSDIIGEMLYIWDEYAREHFDSWDEVPKLKMFNEDYPKAIEAWNKAITKPSQFLVLIQDEKGRIVFEQKDKLSKEDLRFVEKENQKYEELKKQGKI